MLVKLSSMVLPSLSIMVRVGGRCFASSIKRLALVMGLAALPIDGIAHGAQTGQPPNAIASGRSALTPARDFLGALEIHLNAMLERGLMSPGAAKEIRDDFHRYTARFPRLYEQPGFEHAIPTARTLDGPDSSEVEGIKPRRLSEILGATTIRPEEVGEIFRRMFASKKEDGTYYDMFVREYYEALANRGGFRKADGTFDEQAIGASLRRIRDWLPFWTRKLEEMKAAGSFGRFVDAMNRMIAYSETRGLGLQPVQARNSIANLAVCVSAMADTPPETYVESCAGLMLRSDKLRSNAAEIVFYESASGKPEYRRALSKWDAQYADDVFGAVFGDVQAMANDRFWKSYFKLYIKIAQAVEAEMSAAEMSELLKLEIIVGRTAKLLRSYVEKTLFEGRAVGIADIKESLENTKRKKFEFEDRASQTMKQKFQYRETMKGAEQVAERAAMIGIK